jgi:hypothetical protein
LTNVRTLLSFANRRRRGGRIPELSQLGFVDQQDRRPVAVLVTSDGRRVNVPLDELEAASGRVSIHSLLVSILGLLGLIGGSRQEPGGRRTER